MNIIQSSNRNKILGLLKLFFIENWLLDCQKLHRHRWLPTFWHPWAAAIYGPPVSRPYSRAEDLLYQNIIVHGYLLPNVHIHDGPKKVSHSIHDAAISCEEWNWDMGQPYTAPTPAPPWCCFPTDFLIWPTHFSDASTSCAKWIWNQFPNYDVIQPTAWE